MSSSSVYLPSQIERKKYFEIFKKNNLFLNRKIHPRLNCFSSPATHYIFSFLLSSNKKKALHRPISLGNNKFTSLVRIFSALHVNFNDLILASIGSQNTKDIPSNEVESSLIFLGLETFCTPYAKEIREKEPGDFDSRGLDDWKLIDLIVLHTLRLLLNMMEIPYHDSESISELANKLLIPEISSWGDHRVVPLKNNDIAFGRCKVRSQFLKTAIHFNYDLSTMIDEDLESLSIHLNCGTHGIFEIYINNGSNRIEIDCAEEKDYRTIINFLRTTLLGGICPDSTSFQIFYRALTKYLAKQSKPVKRFLRLLKNIVGNHRERITTQLLLQLDFYHYQIPESERTVLTSERMHEIWKELYPVSQKKLKEALQEDPIATLSSFYKVPTKYFGMVYFIVGALALSLAGRVYIENSRFKAQIEEQHQQLMMECITPYSQFIQFSASHWCQVLAEYSDIKEYQNSDVSRTLFKLFIDSCQFDIQKEFTFPELEEDKDNLECDEEVVLPYIEKFLQSEDPLLLAASAAFLMLFVAQNKLKSLGLLRNICLPKLHSNQELKSLAQKIEESLSLFCASEDEEEEKSYLELETVPFEKAEKLHLEDKLNLIIQGAASLSLHLQYEILSSAVNDVPFRQQNQELLIKALYTWGNLALVHESSQFLPRTIFNLCMHSTLQDKMTSTPEAIPFLLNLAQALACEKKSVQEAIKIASKISPQYLPEFQQFIYGLIRLLKIRTEKIEVEEKSKESLNYSFVQLELRKLALKVLSLETIFSMTLHSLIEKILHSASCFSPTEIRTLQKVSYKLIVLRKGSPTEAFQWLTSAPTVKTLGLSCWIKCMLSLIGWLTVVNSSKQSLAHGHLKDQLFSNHTDVFDSGIGSKDRIINYYFDNKQIVILFQDPVERWDILQKLTKWLAEKFKANWCEFAAALLEYFSLNQDTKHIAEIVTHPIFVQSSHPKPQLPSLFKKLYKATFASSFVLLLQLLSSYPALKNVPHWNMLWKKFSTILNIEWVESAFWLWFQKPEYEEETYAYVLLTLFHNSSSLISQFLSSHRLVLSVLTHQANKFSKSELLNFCEHYLTLLSTSVPIPEETTFVPIFLYYLKLDPPLLSITPLHFFIIKTFSGPFYVQALAQLVLNLTNDPIPEFKALLKGFLQSWHGWPVSEDVKILEMQNTLLIKLLKLFPDEHKFYSRCLHSQINGPDSNFQIQLFICVLEKKNLLKSLSETETKSVTEKILKHIESESITYDELKSLYDIYIQFSQVPRLLFNCKRLQLVSSQPLKEVEATLQLFQNDYPKFNDLQEHKYKALCLLVKTIIDLAKVHKNTTRYDFWLNLFFKKLLMKDPLYFEYLVYFFTQLAVQKEGTPELFDALFLDMTWMLVLLLQKENFLTLSNKAIENLITSLENYFFYGTHGMQPQIYFFREGWKKQVFKLSEEYNLFASLPQLKQEIEFCNHKDEACKIIPDHNTQKEVIFRLIARLSAEKSLPWNQLIALFHLCRKNLECYPKKLEEEIECASRILSQADLISQKILLTAQVSTLQTLIFYQTEMDNEILRDFILGEDFTQEVDQLAALQQHTKFFEIAAKSPFIFINKNANVLNHIDKLIELKFFFSANPETKTLLWKEYCKIIHALYQIILFPNQSQNIDELYQILLKFLNYATRKDIQENPHERYTLYCELIIRFYKVHQCDPKIIDNLSTHILEMPITTYWSKTEIVHLIPYALIVAHQNEMGAVSFLWGKTKEHIDKNCQNEIYQGSLLELDQEAHFLLNLCARIILESSELLSDALEQKFRDECFKICVDYGANGFSGKARHLFCIALTCNIPLWKTPQQQYYYLMLMESAMLPIPTWPFAAVSIAVMQGILKGEENKKEKVLAFQTLLKYLYTAAGCDKNKEFYGISPLDKKFLPTYFKWKCSLQTYDEIFPLCNIFITFTPLFKKLWTEGAKSALKAKMPIDSIQFITELYNEDPTTLEELYSVGINSARLLLENFSKHKEKIVWQSIQVFIELFLDRSKKEDIEVFFEILWECSKIKRIFSFEYLPLNKLKSLILKKIMHENIKKAEENCKILTHRFTFRKLFSYPQKIEDIHAGHEIILHVIHHYIKLDNKDEVEKSLIIFGKSISKTIYTLHSPWVKHANDLLDELFQNQNYTYIIHLLTILQKHRLHPPHKIVDRFTNLGIYLSQIPGIEIDLLLSIYKYLPEQLPDTIVSVYREVIKRFYDKCSSIELYAIGLTCLKSRHPEIPYIAYDFLKVVINIQPPKNELKNAFIEFVNLKHSLKDSKDKKYLKHRWEKLHEFLHLFQIKYQLNKTKFDSLKEKALKAMESEISELDEEYKSSLRSIQV